MRPRLACTSASASRFAPCILSILGLIGALAVPGAVRAGTVAGPDATIDKSHAAAFVVGQNGTYTFVVHNIGTTATSSASTVQDTLPSGLSYVSAAGSGWSVSHVGQIVTGTFAGAIAASDSAVFTLTVSVGAGAVPAVTNRATVFSPGESNSLNNTDSDPTTVAGAPDLTIDKRHTSSFAVGVMGTYVFVVRNVGTGATTGATTVQDTLPTGLTVLTTSAPGWTVTQSPSIISGSYARAIAPGDSASFTLFVNVAASAVPSVTNYASVSTAGDVNGANNRDADPTVVSGGPDLVVDKRHTATFHVGASGLYTLVVRNAGGATTTGVTTVTDTLPAGLAYASASGAGWSFGVVGQIVTATSSAAIAAGDSAKFTLTVSVGIAALPSVTNRATVFNSGELNFSNNVDADPTTIAGTPDLSIDKRHTSPFIVGQNASYEIVVTNVGNGATTSLAAVLDTLPAGLTFVSVDGVGWVSSYSGQRFTAAFFNPIAAGDSAKFELNVTVGAAAFPSVTNRAEVSTSDDPNALNDVDFDPTAITGLPDLMLDKRHSGSFTVGGNGSYTFVVTNVGTGPTSGATTVLDTLPAGIAYLSGSGGGWSFSATGPIVTASYLAAIAVGDSAQFALAVGIGAGAFPVVTNRATVFSVGDTNPLNNSDADSAAVAPSPTIYRITSITDVGNDQGRRVRVRWNREQHDAAGGGVTITSYSIWRRIAANLVVAGKPSPIRSNGTMDYPPGDWDFVASVPAHGELTYSTICESLCDSTISQGQCWSVYFVRAESTNPLLYYDTVPDSGYSRDNLPPVPPAALVGSYSGGITNLAWQPNAETDLWYYRVYRGSSQDFIPAAGNLIATSNEASYADPGAAGHYYKLAAVDVSGNTSGFAVLTPGQTLGLPQAGPIEFALEAVRPNPSHGEALRVAFTLPSASPARIELLDVLGRRLVAREVGTLGAGRHVVELTRSKPLSPGVYLVRLTQGGSIRIGRAVVME